MVTGRILTKAEKENLAKQIRQFLLDNELWTDVTIFFNGRAFSTNDRCGNYYNNDPDHLIVLENMDPIDYFSYVSEDDILSMAFEDGLCICLNYPTPGEDQIIKEFKAILDNYDVYYELGDHWNLTCFYKWKLLYYKWK